MDFKTIERAAEQYAQKCTALSETLAALDEDVTAAKKQHLPQVRRRADAAAGAKDALRAEIDSAPELFEKPKSRVLHGVKVGFRKQPGELDFDSEAAVVKRIEQHLPEDLDRLTRVRTNLNKTALGQLSGADLKRLGVTVLGDGEEIVIRLVAGDVEKIVSALLEEAKDYE